MGSLRHDERRHFAGRGSCRFRSVREFSFAPAKERKVSVSTKAKALEQAAATRDARKTMGKNQKKGIKGVVAEKQSTADSETETSATTAVAKPATSATNTPVVNAAGTSNGQATS